MSKEQEKIEYLSNQIRTYRTIIFCKEQIAKYKGQLIQHEEELRVLLNEDREKNNE